MRMILAVGITIIDPRNSVAEMRRIAHKVAAGWLVIGLVCVAIGWALFRYAEANEAEVPQLPAEIVDVVDFSPDMLVPPLDEIRLTGFVQMKAYQTVRFRVPESNIELPYILLPVTGPDWQEGDPISVLAMLDEKSPGDLRQVHARYGIQIGGGTWRMSALVKRGRLLMFTGDISQTLREQGLNITDDVILISPHSESERIAYFRRQTDPLKGSATFIIYMGLVLAAFGLFGRRSGMLPPVR